MTKLGLDAGPGSDGTLSSSSRLLRSEGAGCTRLLDNWRTFNTSADLGVPGIVVTHILDHFESFVGSDGDLNEAKITETIKILNTINTRFENDSIFICVFVIYLLSNQVRHWRVILEAAPRKHRDLILQLCKSGVK